MGNHLRSAWQGARKHVTVNRAIVAIFLLYLVYYVCRDGHAKKLIDVLKQPGIAAIGCVVAVLLRYVMREVMHNALIVEPFTVPKQFQEAGLTPDVIANRISDALRQIETSTQTRMKKDNLALLRDESAAPDIEIPGTKIGLKTVVAMIRALLDIHPKRVCGDIFVTAGDNSKAVVTIYITRGKERSRGISLDVALGDIESLAQRTAEMVLGQVNPYILASYRFERRQLDQAVEIVRGMVEDPSEDQIRRSAAFNLWGIVLAEEQSYDEAVAKYKEAIELDPKYALAYNNWGNVFLQQKDYDRAVAKYQKTIELDPKCEIAYGNWGNVLSAQKNYDEAAAKYQKAIEIDPKFALAYDNWGVVLEQLGKRGEAEEKFAKARELESSQ